jgi:chromosome partitioning protein
VRTIAVVNQKGGCGKTTTTINLAAFLARAGRRTLVVDMDPQGHATLGLVKSADDLSATVYDVFVAKLGGRPATLQDVTLKVNQNLDLVPADIRLSALPDVASSVAGRQTLLAELVDAVRTRYDYMIVDCPPSVGTLTFNALMACTEAVVPIEPGFFSLHGVAKLLETFDMLARDALHVITPRALVTFYCGRTRFAREVREEVRRHLGGRCFDTVIRHSVKLAEAASYGLPIVEYCKTCVGFDDYALLCAEVLEAEAALNFRPLDLDAGSESRTPAPGAPSLTSPQVTADGVVFALEAPQAHAVQLVGDFNGWEVAGHEMQPAGPVWKSVLRLDPGRYRYRYIVDGEWQNDPLNSEVEPAPFGGYNSVIVVQDRLADDASLQNRYH